MTPCEQMTIGMLSAYCVALRIIETSPSLDEARRRMESVWHETRRVFDMEDERMIPEGMLPFMDNGRLLYKAQQGYKRMLWIRAWCGCRQYVEGEDDERDQDAEVRRVRRSDQAHRV